MADGSRRIAEPGEGIVSDRLLTLPNVLSSLRLVGVPVFIWAILTAHDGIAVVTLILSGLSDYLDGKIARKWHLESRVGELLDPIADRLYILSTLLGLAYREIIPWWLVLVLVSREVFLSIGLLIAKRHGQTGLPVHFVGKAATFNLLYAFPFLLLAQGESTFAQWALPIGWAFAWWGTILYWMAGLMYAVQVRQVVAARRGPASAAPATPAT